MPLHTIALRKWAPAALLISSLLWALVLLGAPYLVSRRVHSPTVLGGASAAYLLGSVICHQRAERSFHPWGVQVPVCARCEGIYLAAPFGLAFAFAARRRGVAPASRSRWQRIVMVAAIPTMVTLAWEWGGGGMPSGILRALAGAAIGAAVAGVVAAAAVGELR